MKRIRIIAIISAAVTALAVYLFLSNANKPVDIPRTPVVLALVKISAGQEIKAEMIEVREMPKEAVHPQAARSADEVLGRISSANVEPGEQLLVSRFYRAGEANDTLAYSLEKGKRAVTIQVDPVSGISGLVKPRDHVDVLAILVAKVQLWKMNAEISPNSAIVSYKLGDPEDHAYSLLPLQNVLVLATGQAMQANSDNKTTTVEQVTLSVTPEQAVLLNYLAAEGRIRLALRAPTDKDTVDVQQLEINDILTVSTWDDLLANIKKMSESGLPTPAPTTKPKP